MAHQSKCSHYARRKYAYTACSGKRKRTNERLNSQRANSSKQTTLRPRRVLKAMGYLTYNFKLSREFLRVW